MTPTTEIIPGHITPPEDLVIYGKNQLQYQPLPAIIVDGKVVTRWMLTDKEVEEIVKSKSIWLSILTYGRQLQPVLLESQCPLEVHEISEEIVETSEGSVQ